jgi:lipopolysaccharide/colanic/teichoic acid biosynthesis glycosyltransferase
MQGALIDMSSYSTELAVPLDADCKDNSAISFPARYKTAKVRANSGSRWVLSRSRRIFDCVMASIALLVGLPLMLIVALAVRVDSRGPILFRQRRMGRNGKEFVLLKFRSMSLSAPLGSRITVAGDVRVTRVGRILRRLKLDEFPQFWNVLKGDMGLVGPRPKLAHHEGLLMSYRPGITGFATLVFRREESLLASVPAADLDDFYHDFIKPSKARLDEVYMENATLSSDLRILLKTAISWMRPPDHPVLDRLEREACLMYEQAARTSSAD